MDKIRIVDLSTRCIIGINDDERRSKQDVLINITLEADLSVAGRSDQFSDTVDYRALKKRILATVEPSEFMLIEAMAETIADICLDTPGVMAALVLVEKPTALRFARSVGVEIYRQRK